MEIKRAFVIFSASLFCILQIRGLRLMKLDCAERHGESLRRIGEKTGAGKRLANSMQLVKNLNIFPACRVFGLDWIPVSFPAVVFKALRRRGQKGPL